MDPFAHEPELREMMARLKRVRETPRPAGTDTPGPPPTVSGHAGGTSEFPTVPGYEILGRLGRGGMGVVYQAREVSCGRLVALKMLRGDGPADSEAHVRFLSEIESATSLHHPNIVPIYEVGRDADHPYFTMELVGGGSLTARIGGTPQPPLPGAELVETLARAMQYAHDRKIVHRDLTPANVLLAADGTPKITDFGLAKRLEVGSGLTQTGAVLGTPPYMAPEQVGGKPGAVGPWTDVYALGAILYEWLTGRPPFKGQTPLDTMHQVLGDEPIPPCRLQPRVPYDLETICLHCLRKEPARRYASAAALADDLQRFLSQAEPIHARRAGVVGRAGRWCRQHPAVAGLAAAVAALLVTATVISTVAAVRIDAARNAALMAQGDAERAADREREARGRVEEEKTKGEELWESLLVAARAVRSGSQAGQRFGSLQALARVAAFRPSPELRNEAIAFMTLTDLKAIRAVQLPSGTASNALDIDPQARLYAHSDLAGKVVIRRVADDRVTDTWEVGNPAWVGRFSPDGRFLAAKFHPRGAPGGLPNRVRIRDVLAGRNVADELNIRDMHEHACAFRPNSESLAVGGADGKVWLYDLSAEKRPPRLLAEVPLPVCLDFDPEGGRLAVFGARDRTVVMIDVASGKQIRLPRHDAQAMCLAWGSEGRLAVAGGADTGQRYPIYVWDMARPHEPLILRGHTSEITHVAFSHGGDLLVSSSWDKTTRLWDPWTGRQLVSADRGDIRARFGPDDRLLAGPAGGAFLAWEVATGRECRTLHGHAAGYKGPWGLDYGPGGNVLASAGNDGVQLWEVASGKKLPSLPVEGAHGVLFHPQREWLITCGASGVQRWPVGSDFLRGGGSLAGGGSVFIGRPERLADLQTDGVDRNRACLGGKNGNLLAVTDSGRREAIVVDLDGPPLNRRGLPPGGVGLATIALSPDGRWIATGTYGGRGIRVWDLASNETRELTGEAGNGFVAFSPDSRSLVTSLNGYTRWRVGTWERSEIRRASGDGPIAFTPDGKMLAITTNGTSIHLLDTTTFEELAVLTAPNLAPLTWFCFSPDGAQLAAATASHMVQLWDLRTIRRQLAEMNLDWDRVRHPWVGEAGPPKPLRVRVPDVK